jgi:hypothetical protein
MTDDKDTNTLIEEGLWQQFEQAKEESRLAAQHVITQMVKQGKMKMAIAASQSL